MTEKEKARAYDEALKKARQLCDYPTTKPFISDLQDLFPELKESEDEKIRKILVEAVTQVLQDQYCSNRGVSKEKIVAWLENQAEQKDNNKLIWKHWSGCGIAGNGDGTQIYLIKQYNTYSVCSCLSSECDYILLSDLDKLISDGDADVRYRYLDDILIEHIEHGKYYYCIKDYYSGGCKRASKGEVIQALRGMGMMALGVEANEYFIPVKCIVDDRHTWSEEDEDAIGMAIIALEDMYDEDAPNTTYGGYNLPFNKAAERLKSIKDRVQPKPMQEWKQENIEELTEFENAMMHIGGSFFGENAGLDPNDTDTIKEQAELLLELAPKQEWSEEDEEYINDLIGVFDGQQHQAHSDEEVVNWLKSIRLQCNKEWGERDEEMLKSIIATCELACEDRDSSPARHLLKMQTNWLKSLRPQSKHEWSEEDEHRINRISDFIWKNRKGDTDEIYQQEQDVNWLKSLKSHITWKPSEGQLECLDYAIDKTEKDYSPLVNNRIYLTLKTLKEELEKLIE